MEALHAVEINLRTGVPMSPRLAQQLRDVIGETSPEEEAMLRSAREMREVEAREGAGL